MKFNSIALAAATLVAAASAQAALPTNVKTVVEAANTANRVVFVSGASAVQKGFESLVSRLLDSPVYFNSESSKTLDGSGYMAVVGTLKKAEGDWAQGDAVMLIYRNSGGSYFGVNPIGRDSEKVIQSLLVTDASCSDGSTLPGTPGSAARPFLCTSNATTTAIPDAGISDVDPILFTKPYNTEKDPAASALTTAERGTITTSRLYAQAFGVPVTKNVGYGAEFNRATVAAIMSGAISTWDQVKGTALSAGVESDIVICRRVPGSGSQAVMNLWTGNYPCSTSAVSLPLDRGASPAWKSATKQFLPATAIGNGNPIVIENSGSGEVRDCLKAAANGTSYNTKDRNGAAVTVNFQGKKFGAIGVLSLDSIASSTSAEVWQFRSLNGAGYLTADGLDATTAPVTNGTGVFPTLENLTTGNWDMQGLTSFNVPARTTGAKLSFLNDLLAAAQDPDVLAAVKETKWTAAAFPLNVAAMPTPPVNTTNVLKTSYVGDNQCAPMIRNFP